MYVNVTNPSPRPKMKQDTAQQSEDVDDSEGDDDSEDNDNSAGLEINFFIREPAGD